VLPLHPRTARADNLARAAHGWRAIELMLRCKQPGGEKEVVWAFAAARPFTQEPLAPLWRV
jgi:hypothetical protein